MESTKIQPSVTFEHEEDLYVICKVMDRRFDAGRLSWISRWLPHLPVFWRHQNPIDDKYSHQTVYGRVVRSEAVPPMGIVSILRLYGNSEHPIIYARRKALQLLVKKSIASGIDIGSSLTIEIVYKNDVAVEVEPFEISITPWPDCETCIVKPRLVKMVEEEEKKEEEDVDEIKKKIDENLEKASIEELQSLLNAKITQLESVEEEAKKWKCKADESGDMIKKLRESLETKEKKASTLEDKVNDLTDKVTKLMSALEDERRAGPIEKLKELDKAGLYDDELISVMSLEKIKEKIKKLKDEEATRSKVKVTSMETSVKNAKDKDEESQLQIDLLKSEIKDLEKAVDPDTEIYKKIKRLRK